MTGIAAVVFDLDGLLVDSEPLQAWAWDEYVKRFGLRLTPDVLHRMLGRRAVDAVEIAIEMLDLPVTGAEALRDRDDIFLAAVPGAIAPMDGALELLAELHGRTLPVALATSGHRRYVDLALASAGLTGMFDVEVTGEMVARGKPHPDTYLRAAQMAGAALWILYGVMIHAIPVVVANGLVFAAAAWTLLRAKSAAPVATGS